jgi:tRNA pseudouridine55 synthase
VHGILPATQSFYSGHVKSGSETPPTLAYEYAEYTVVANPLGILNVNKLPELTSRDVVTQIERLVPGAKCGHAGTLDPLATGVLVVCVGRATRLVQYVQRQPKRYRTTFLLGRESRTDDVEGEVQSVPGAPEPTRDKIVAALPAFLGDIQQRPPAHSAIKVDGRRSYERARKGEQFELPARSVTIHRLDILRYEYPELDLAIECGSGTYVRSLGRDLAVALGTRAVMSALERTATGEFRIEDAVSLDELNNDNLADHLQPALAAVADLPRIALDDAQLTELRHGRPIAMPACAPDSARAAAEWAAVNPVGDLASILCEKLPRQLWPKINFVA